MIVARAPGKLFVAGEYAVLDPGHPAVLVAVDRYVTVRLTEARGPWTTLHSDSLGGITLRCRRTGGNLITDVCPEQVHDEFRYVLAALSTVDALITELGLSPRPLRLAITSELTDRDGRKLGLGSSAAATVATVDALEQFYRLEPSPMRRYRLALLATVTICPETSGADLAASVWGGWLGYSAPDRHYIAALAQDHGVDTALRHDWPGLTVHPLPHPANLRLLAGWTGHPASTTKMIDAQRRVAEVDGYHRRFLSDSAACVYSLVAALRADDPKWAQDEIRCARHLLAELDDATGAGIMTPALTALCAGAEAVGAAAKPSGAGGGDCGIALVTADAEARIDELYERWTEADIRPLPLRIVAPTE